MKKIIKIGKILNKSCIKPKEHSNNGLKILDGNSSRVDFRKNK